MHALIVVSHANPASLTHAIAHRVADGITSADPAATTEFADLTAERFDPVFNSDDLAYFEKRAAAPDDVAREHARLERADTLVLVYPIYWWSFPGLLKGWIDRVFSNGWAYDEGPDGKLQKKLQRLQVHLVANGGADAGMIERHGYAKAMATQIDHGIFDYCGANVASSARLLASDPGFPAAHLDTAHAIGRRIANLGN